MMTRRDFEALALMIAQGIADMIDRASLMCVDSNPRFDQKKFQDRVIELLNNSTYL